jgi:uncharacterized glyoxalase superfamily protein PhnB
MLTNRSMPPGIFIPELAYADVAVAAEWLCRAFGFRERLRIADHRIQLVFDGASMVVTERMDDSQPVDMAHGVMVRVSDVDQHHARAHDNGARIIHPLENFPFGERRYTAEDIGGHRWVFSQSIADVHPADWGGTWRETP